VENGSRVGKAGRFEEDPAQSRDFTAIRLLGQDLQGRNEIAPDGAADAAARDQDELLVGLLDELVVQPDLAELVDDDGSPREFALAQQR